MVANESPKKDSLCDCEKHNRRIFSMLLRFLDVEINSSWEFKHLYNLLSRFESIIISNVTTHRLTAIFRKVTIKMIYKNEQNTTLLCHNKFCYASYFVERGESEYSCISKRFKSFIKEENIYFGIDQIEFSGTHSFQMNSMQVKRIFQVSCYTIYLTKEQFEKIQSNSCFEIINQ